MTLSEYILGSSKQNSLSFILNYILNKFCLEITCIQENIKYLKQGGINITMILRFLITKTESDSVCAFVKDEGHFVLAITMWSSPMCGAM
jgi:hypothetical protein